MFLFRCLIAFCLVLLLMLFGWSLKLLDVHVLGITAGFRSSTVHLFVLDVRDLKISVENVNIFDLFFFIFYFLFPSLQSFPVVNAFAG